jgi:hypothetical protein
MYSFEYRCYGEEEPDDEDYRHNHPEPYQELHGISFHLIEHPHVSTSPISPISLRELRETPIAGLLLVGDLLRLLLYLPRELLVAALFPHPGDALISPCALLPTLPILLLLLLLLLLLWLLMLLLWPLWLLLLIDESLLPHRHVFGSGSLVEFSSMLDAAISPADPSSASFDRASPDIYEVILFNQRSEVIGLNHLLHGP